MMDRQLNDDPSSQSIVLRDYRSRFTLDWCGTKSSSNALEKAKAYLAFHRPDVRADQLTSSFSTGPSKYANDRFE